MSSLGTVLLLNIFPALLPPINEEDRDFYEVLGLQKSATEQEIRKAYKVKSLSLHPDKVAQRRASVITAEEAAKEYQLVQEAHSCLSDKASRQKYHAVKCSPTRYRFLTQGGGLGNQMALVKNLSQASFADKTKLVILVSIFPLILLIQPILIAVKVNHVLDQDGGLQDASWVALLIPWWLFHGILCAFFFFISAMAPPEARPSVLSTALEQLLWLIALLLLALRWDQTITSSYAAIFTPVYFALILKWIHFVVIMGAISQDMAKMISKDKFLKDVLRGREPEELEEEELKELHGKYVVVSQIPADVQHDLEHDEDDKKLSDEDKEEIRVASSREFEAATEAYNTARRNLVKSAVLDVAFLILIILKVDDHVNMSWWVVFVPILIAYGLRILSNCFVCCCAGSPMDPEEVAILAMKKDELVAEAEGKDGEKEESEEANGPGSDNPPADGSFAIDAEVLLHSLKSEEFNGKIGVVKGSLKDGRQEVYIKDLDKTAALKIVNMKIKDEAKQTSAPTTAEASATSTKAKSKSEDISESSTTKKSKQPTSKEASPAKNTAASTATEDEKGDNNKKDGDGDEKIHIDEETYKAYQSAYAAAEENAMEDQIKAGQNNCAAIFALTMICLLIAKLEQATEAEDERDEKGDDADVDVGFNTLWLLFPLFLIAGFILFCCACLIYSAPDPEDLMKQQGEGADEEAGEGVAVQDGEGDAETPIVIAPPPPPPAASEDEAPAVVSGIVEEAKKEPEVKIIPPEVESDMNDLD